MLVKTLIALVCAAGSTFYVRYLVALWKEREPLANGDWLRLRPSTRQDTVVELRERTEAVTRAA